VIVDALFEILERASRLDVRIDATKLRFDPVVSSFSGDFDFFGRVQLLSANRRYVEA